MSTSKNWMLGYPPVVTVTERELLVNLPEEEQAPFLSHLRTLPGGWSRNGINIPVFNKELYAQWKAKQ